MNHQPTEPGGRTILDHQSLKNRHREIRDRFPHSLSLRVHRALSWLKRAEQEVQDYDARFIFLWVAFNAAYANQVPDRQNSSERAQFQGFLGRLIDSDSEHLLYELVWNRFSGAIRLLVDNQYVFQPFWDYQNGLLSDEEWQSAFRKSKAAARRALGKMDTLKIMGVMFERLYTLRNQLLHGGATWNSHVNRSQISQGAEIMEQVVPIVIHLMMNDHQRVWGDPCYPVVD
ncbi:MAG: hypothetical protein WBS20_11140 [Lysobacterales bacterium]